MHHCSHGHRFWDSLPILAPLYSFLLVINVYYLVKVLRERWCPLRDGYFNSSSSQTTGGVSQSNQRRRKAVIRKRHHFYSDKKQRLRKESQQFGLLLSCLIIAVVLIRGWLRWSLTKGNNNNNNKDNHNHSSEEVVYHNTRRTLTVLVHGLIICFFATLLTFERIKLENVFSNTLYEITMKNRRVYWLLLGCYVISALLWIVVGKHSASHDRQLLVLIRVLVCLINGSLWVGPFAYVGLQFSSRLIAIVVQTEQSKIETLIQMQWEKKLSEDTILSLGGVPSTSLVNENNNDHNNVDDSGVDFISDDQSGQRRTSCIDILSESSMRLTMNKSRLSAGYQPPSMHPDSSQMIQPMMRELKSEKHNHHSDHDESEDEDDGDDGDVHQLLSVDPFAPMIRPQRSEEEWRLRGTESASTRLSRQKAPVLAPKLRSITLLSTVQKQRLSDFRDDSQKHFLKIVAKHTVISMWMCVGALLFTVALVLDSIYKCFSTGILIALVLEGSSLLCISVSLFLNDNRMTYDRVCGFFDEWVAKSAVLIAKVRVDRINHTKHSLDQYECDNDGYVQLYD